MGLFKRDPDGPPAYDGPPGPTPPEKGERLSMPPSAQAQAGPSNAALYACIMLSSTDRMRLVNFPPHVTEIVRHALSVAWPIGLQIDAPVNMGVRCHEFKLKGNPCELGWEQRAGGGGAGAMGTSWPRWPKQCWPGELAGGAGRLLACPLASLLARSVGQKCGGGRGLAPRHR